MANGAARGEEAQTFSDKELKQAKGSEGDEAKYKICVRIGSLMNVVKRKESAKKKTNAGGDAWVNK